MKDKDIRKLNPIITQSVLNDKTAGSDKDTIGSYEDNRRGSLHGAPSVTWFSADPVSRVIDIPVLTVDNNIHIKGYNMMTTSNIYLSASSSYMFSEPASEYSYFVNNYTNRLREEFPSFTGISLSAWAVVDNNYIIVPLLTPLSAGGIDIILQGPAGYGKTSQSTFTSTYKDKNIININNPS
tara:strand:+ start:5697 stop:6242 length:546 start_codon:yes stop_codon:yes gene_type:complete